MVKAIALVLGLLGMAGGVVAAEPGVVAKPATPNRADEPRIAAFSLARAAEFLDAASLDWTAKRACGACHTNYPYLMARPMLKDNGGQVLAEVRSFFEHRAANWDAPPQEGKPNPRPRWPAEVVMTAATLAFNDAHTSGKLHPVTRQALDRMWTLQRSVPLETLPALALAGVPGGLADRAVLAVQTQELAKLYGSWNWLKCEWPPAEHDDYYGVILGLIGACSAPEGYRNTPAAKAGIARAVAFLKNNPAPTVHHRALLLWASTYAPEVMTAPARDAIVAELLRLQQEDGGWSLHRMGPWQGVWKAKSPVDYSSDGYGTGLAVFVLRQAGMPANNPALQKAVAWLKANQRESGRWFTTSLNTDRYHFVSHMGTAYAVMALRACGVE